MKTVLVYQTVITFRRSILLLIFFITISCRENLKICRQKQDLIGHYSVFRNYNGISYEGPVLLNLPARIITSLIDKGMSDKEDIKNLLGRQILINSEEKMLIETFQYIDYSFLIEDLPFMAFDYTLIAASTENFNEKIIDSYKKYNIKLANDSTVSVLHASPYYFLLFSDQKNTSQKGELREYPTQYTLSTELVTSYNISIVKLWRAYKANLLTPKMLGVNRYQDCPHKTGQDCFSLYINEDFKGQNLILESYFEIILWSAYKPDGSTFKITDSKGQIKKMSFTSLVDNRQYEIKCNIDFPYCYKIKAL